MPGRQIRRDGGDTAIEIFRFAEVGPVPIETAKAEVIAVIVGLGFHRAAIGGDGFIGTVGLIVRAGEPPPRLRIVRVELRGAGEGAERWLVRAMTLLER